MKIPICLLVSLCWGLMLVHSLVLPNNEVKEAPKEAPKEAAAALMENRAELPPDPKLHNIDLSKVETSGKEKAELVEKTAVPWDSRQVIFNDYVNLKWIQWTGSLPSGAVSIINQYTGLTDYVCSEQDCSTGFYSPTKGSFCFYSLNGLEYRTSSFKILVNEDNFELLQWQSGSYGSVPIDPIGRCPGVYVGKNNYGLGKMIPNLKVLLLPFNGYEYSYDYYEVLHLYANYHTQYIDNVGYYTSQITYRFQPTQVLASSKVINNVCQTLKRTVTLSKTTVNDQTWDIDRQTKIGVTSILLTQIPSFSGNSISFMNSEEFEWNEGISRSKTQTHTRRVEISVAPNNECDVVLEGKTISATMPFSAKLSRTYQNGEKRSTAIRGAFTNVQTDEVTAVIRQCKRIPNSAPCRSG